MTKFIAAKTPRIMITAIGPVVRQAQPEERNHGSR